MQMKEYSTERKLSKSTKAFFKAFLWTVIALSLIFIGYFGAEMLFG